MEKNKFSNVTNSKINIFLENIEDIFISDFSELANCLKNNVEFIIINSASIDLIYNNNIIHGYKQFIYDLDNCTQNNTNNNIIKNAYNQRNYSK